MGLYSHVWKHKIVVNCYKQNKINIISIFQPMLKPLVSNQQKCYSTILITSNRKSWECSKLGKRNACSLTIINNCLNNGAFLRLFVHLCSFCKRFVGFCLDNAWSKSTNLGEKTGLVLFLFFVYCFHHDFSFHPQFWQNWGLVPSRVLYK
jgi:hypothetical protein